MNWLLITKLLHLANTEFPKFFNVSATEYNRPLQVKCVAAVTKCDLRLETAPTVNRDGQVFTNGKYWKCFSKLFHFTRRMKLVFQLNECVFPNDITQYLSGYNPMIELTNLSR